MASEELTGFASGATTGAVAGSAFGTVGSVVGGVIGGAVGFFSSRSKKKAAKKAFKRQRAMLKRQARMQKLKLTIGARKAAARSTAATVAAGISGGIVRSAEIARKSAITAGVKDINQDLRLAIKAAKGGRDAALSNIVNQNLSQLGTAVGAGVTALATSGVTLPGLPERASGTDVLGVNLGESGGAESFRGVQIEEPDLFTIE
jgi:Na+/glutamate symporter